MKTFTVHQPPDPPADRIDRAETLVFVKDGFHWLAAIFGPLWLLFKGLWLALLVYVVMVVLISLGLALLGASDQTAAAVSFALNLIIGFEAGSIERWALERRHWRTIATVSGHDRDECERRFFEAWLPSQPAIAATLPQMRTGTLADAAGDLQLSSAMPAGTPAPTVQRGSGWRRMFGRR